MALKILLADDSMTAQNMGKKILVDAGYEVVAVSNGAAAMKKIVSDRPDIAILDFYMPGYQGDEVCERVKASPETAHIPVLLTVGKMEPFNPEKANKVKADGVLIKPFEATDLIAAVQSIGSRGKVPTPAATTPPRTPILSHNQPAVVAQETTVRIPPPVASVASIVDTLRIPPPPTAKTGVPPKLEETVPVPPPKSVGHEDTIRLTPEQVRAFQDKSYRDWVSTTGPANPAEEAVVEALPVTPQPEQVPVMSVEPVAPVMQVEEPSSEVTATPMFGPAAEEDADSTATIHEVFSIQPPEIPVHAVEEDHAVETASAPARPFFAFEAADAPTMEMRVPESIQAVVPDVPTEEISIPSVQVHELETSATIPVETPSIVEPLVELEHTSAAPVMEVVAEAAPELEINSPIHLQENVETAADAALVTNDEDMSQFVTKFGVEKPEEIAVGIASDLPPEQLAAITAPVSEAHVIEHVAEPEPTPMMEVSHSVLEEVHAEPAESAMVEPISTPEPVVAFVPGIEDTQGFGTYTPSSTEPEPMYAAEIAPEPAVIQEPVIAAEVQPDPVEVARLETITTETPVAESVPVPELEAVPDFVTAPVELAAPAAAEAIAGAPLEHGHVDEHEAASHPTIEASAVAAVAAVGAGLGYLATHHESAPVVEPEPEAVHAEQSGEVAQVAEVPTEVAVETPAVVAPEGPAHEAFGDAALAEELAAALDHKESEERAKSATEAAAAVPIEPAVSAAVAEASEHSYSDSKLSEAVARAIEHLKPQLIAEILKELMNK